MLCGAWVGVFRDVNIVGEAMIVERGGAAQGSVPVGPTGEVTPHGTAFELANGSDWASRGPGTGCVDALLSPWLGGAVRCGRGEVDLRGMDGVRCVCGAKGSWSGRGESGWAGTGEVRWGNGREGVPLGSECEGGGVGAKGSATGVGMLVCVARSVVRDGVNEELGAKGS